MHKTVFYFSFLFILGCKSTSSKLKVVTKAADFKIAFGSCNKHTIDNLLWDDISAAKPDIWIWGGDIVYADTDDMGKLRTVYNAQNEIQGYKNLKKEVPIIGTWDDHDYGLNDGGVEFGAKHESQIEFLNFMGVAKDSPRRERKGVYFAHNYNMVDGKIKVIVLDTRYFRTALTLDTETKKRFRSNTYGEGTMLGERQWQWLEAQLKNSKADFNIIVSSIQFLSNEHGFETWGNFPHEVDKLKIIIENSQANGVVILSGDRHISEFSITAVEGVPYPLIDFTSSGLTHTYAEYKGEPNPFRVGETISTESFGLLHFDFKNKEVFFEIVGDGGAVLEELSQKY